MLIKILSSTKPKVRKLDMFLNTYQSKPHVARIKESLAEDIFHSRIDQPDIFEGLPDLDFEILEPYLEKVSQFL